MLTRIIVVLLLGLVQSLFGLAKAQQPKLRLAWMMSGLMTS